MKHTFVIPVVLQLLLLQTAAHAAPAQDAQAIVRRVDEIRYPQRDFRVDVNVRVVRPGHPEHSARYRLFVSRRDRSAIKSLEPVAERGKVLLMRGNDLWAYLPSVSKPLRLSLRERLFGDVSNADVARVSFAGDYRAELVRTESIEGREYQLLRLSARTEEVTYAKILLWVEPKSGRPFQAQYYGVSGKMLKTCVFTAFREAGGRARPMRLIMSDPLIREQYSVIDYDAMAVAPIPDKVFTQGYLQKLAD
jgi:outer membrane lipoprotein-sorting protein